MNPKNLDKMVIKICNDYCYPLPASITLNPRLKDCLGRCMCETGEIQLNEYVVLNNPKEIVEALLKHEVVHLRHCNHSKSFKKAAEIIGTTMYVSDLYPNINLPYRFTYECPVCHGKFYHDKRVDLACGECTKEYSKKFKLKLIRKNYE